MSQFGSADLAEEEAPCLDFSVATAEDDNLYDVCFVRVRARDYLVIPVASRLLGMLVALVSTPERRLQQEREA